MARNRFFAVLLVLIATVAGCSSSGPADPKQTVIAMFGAMEKDDMATLAHLLDLTELMKDKGEDYALQTNQPRAFVNPQQILEDLTGDGLTKKRWFSYQRVINKTEMYGESASVEVTFVDKEASQGFMTRFGVHMVNGKWKIYSFKTIEG
ncbi:MAG: hypothetical protein ACE5FH_07485 [Candidatus Zixiibacteriota bacterium]